MYEDVKIDWMFHTRELSESLFLKPLCVSVHKVYKFKTSPWSFKLVVIPFIHSRNGIERTNARPTRHNNNDEVGKPTYIPECFPAP